MLFGSGWIKGVKGFRLDVFNLYFKDEEFRDNPIRPFQVRPDQRQEMKYNCDLPEMMDVLADIRGILDQYEDAYAVGETFLGTPEKAAGYCGEHALHQAFLFDFLECPWNAGCFSRVAYEWQSALGEENWPNYVLNNHDVKRSASRYGKGEDDERLKVAAAMLLTLRGTPFLYYGEEIGMREVRLEEVADIWIRSGCVSGLFTREGMAAERPCSGMAVKNAGFSSGGPWLPLHSDWRERNLSRQMNRSCFVV